MSSLPFKIDDISLVVFDFDGVLTDNRVLVMEDGPEGVFVNRSAGWGIARLREKLRDNAGEPRILLTVRGKGYMFARQEE